jgi:hypothetical protein
MLRKNKYIKPFSFYCGSKSLASFIGYLTPLTGQIFFRNLKDHCSKMLKKVGAHLCAAQTLNVILMYQSQMFAYNVTEEPLMLYTFMSVDYRNIM